MDADCSPHLFGAGAVNSSFIFGLLTFKPIGLLIIKFYIRTIECPLFVFFSNFSLCMIFKRTNQHRKTTQEIFNQILSTSYSEKEAKITNVFYDLEKYNTYSYNFYSNQFRNIGFLSVYKINFRLVWELVLQKSIKSLIRLFYGAFFYTV